MSDYIEAAITNELTDLQAAREGGRNAQLFKSAAALYGLAKGGAIARDRIQRELETAAQAIGLTKAEIQATLESAWKSAEAREVKSTDTPPPTSKRAYANLDDYAQEHGVSADAYIKAGWEWTIHMNRPCLHYTVKDRDGKAWNRYRFTDGSDPRFINDTGYKSVWYGLDRALTTKPKVLVLCNGAPSVVAAQTWGVPAIAQEGGENALTPENLTELNSKWSGPIYICLEADDKGKATAAKWLAQMPNAKQIDLNLTGSQDLADFCKLYLKDSLSELHHRAQVAPNDDVSISIQVLADRNAKEMADIQAGKVTKLGLLSHIPELDNAVGSFMPRRVHTILGATGMGKSTFAVSISMALLWQAAGLWVTTETSPELWFNKMLAYAAKVPVDKIIEGTYTAQEAQRIAAMRAKLTPMQSRIYDKGAPEVGTICDWVKRWQDKIGVQWVMIDSISRLKATGKNGIFDRVSEVADALQDLARETGITIIGTSQVGRKMDDRSSKIPRITDGKGSGAIEENSDVIIPLYYHHYYVTKKLVAKDDPLNDTMPEGKAMVYVGKHRYRYASESTIWLQFRGGIGFYEWPKSPSIPTQVTMPIEQPSDRLQDIVF